MDYKFQINLGGIIDLLSNHIYSSPQIYVRELLQNGVDAILARRYVEPEHAGAIRIRVFGETAESGQPSLVFEDNGVGLNEEEIHRFLATIGQTSKRGDLLEQRTDYIGQFGIGLLSCFVVSDEIVVVTRSAKGDAAHTMEWRGRADGTYSIRTLDEEIEPGTRVQLRCKAGSEEYFKPQAVRRMARHYGSLLPYPITLAEGNGAPLPVNEEQPPWKRTFTDADEERAAYLEYGRETFEMTFFDYVPRRVVSATGANSGRTLRRA